MHKNYLSLGLSIFEKMWLFSHHHYSIGFRQKELHEKYSNQMNPMQVYCVKHICELNLMLTKIIVLASCLNFTIKPYNRQPSNLL